MILKAKEISKLEVQYVLLYYKIEVEVQFILKYSRYQCNRIREFIRYYYEVLMIKNIFYKKRVKSKYTEILRHEIVRRFKNKKIG